MEFNQENLEAFITIAIAIMILSALVDAIHKRADKTKIANEVEDLFKNNKDLISIAEHIDVLNGEIHNRMNEMESLDDELISKQQDLENLKNRIQFLENNPQLQNAAEVKIQLSKLEDLKATLSKINSKHAHRFQVSLLVELIKELYFDLYGSDISIQEIEEILRAYGSDSNGGSGFSGGKQTNKPNTKQSLRDKINKGGPSL